MNTAELRSELLHTIEHMNIAQLKEFYGLLQNYINSSSTEEWDSLTALQKEKIERSIMLANEGKTIPLLTATSRLKRKYSSNG